MKPGLIKALLMQNCILMFRKDRHGRGGGVLLYNSEELNAGLNGKLTSNTFQESIWCNIKTGKSSMLVNLCYRCPTSSESTNDSLLKLITKASDLCSYSGVGSNFQGGGGRMPARSADRNFVDVPPHFSLVPPHEGAQRLFVTD